MGSLGAVKESLPAWAMNATETCVLGLGERWKHAQGVAAVAVQLSPDAPGAAETLGFAGLLHDIGYASRLRRTGMHAIDGAMALRDLGAPRQVVSLVAFHTGAEYEAIERGLSRQLSQFDRPRQNLLDALILADLTVGPAGQALSVSDRLDDIFDRYPAGHIVHRAVKASRAYLLGCAERAERRAAGQPI